MKKLLILLLMSSCGYNPASTYKGVVVDEIVMTREGCNYYGNASDMMLFGSPSFRIIDTCGKFNIGDTIKFVK